MKTLSALIPTLLAAWVLAQAPKAGIEGIVVLIGTEEPVAGAQVSLSVNQTSPRPVIPPVMTDRQGRFSFKELDAGAYSLTVSTGYSGSLRAAIT